MIVDEIRRRSVVDFETVQSLDELIGYDAAPSPERIALARAELKWVMGLIANLPGRCRQIVKLRKVYGLSQAETAKSLGVSENIVEKETLRGLTAISEMIARVSLASDRVSRKTTSWETGRAMQTNGHGKD
jgi:RNA polymerase sigma-70 factor (ECF subfamily)